MLRLKEQDYLGDVEMHYALIGAASRMAPKFHCHEFFEIFLIVEGLIEHQVNGERVLVETGTLTFIRPDDIHRFRVYKQASCQMINLAISRKAIKDLFLYLGDGFKSDALLLPHIPPSVTLSSHPKQQIMQKLEHLNSIALNQAELKRSTLRMLLFDLVTQLLPSERLVSNPLPHWLEKSCAEMHKPENLLRGLSAMLELTTVSREHLSRSMRKYLGQTPTAFINELRLTQAANLLRHGDKSILTISSELGFDSLSYFYTLFKKHYGQTPRQFRRSSQPPFFER